MKEFFKEYQKKITSSEKIGLLHEELFKSKDNVKKATIINCLIALENNNIKQKHLDLLNGKTAESKDFYDDQCKDCDENQRKQCEYENSKDNNDGCINILNLYENWFLNKADLQPLKNEKEVIGTEGFSNSKESEEMDQWWEFTKGVIYFKLGKFNKHNAEKACYIFEAFNKKYEKESKDKEEYLLFYLGYSYYQKAKLENERSESIKAFEKAIKNFGKIVIDYGEKDFQYTAIVLNIIGDIVVKLQKLKGINKYEITCKDKANLKLLEEKDESLGDKPLSLTQIYANFKEEFREKFDKEKIELENINPMDLYKKSLEFYGEFSYPYNGIGNKYRESGEYLDAIKFYSKAIELDDNFMYPWNYIGDCFKYLGKYKMAFKCYEKAKNMCSDESILMPLYGLGRVYYELANRQNSNEKYYVKAIKYFKEALEKKDKYKCKRLIEQSKINGGREIAKDDEDLGVIIQNCDSKPPQIRFALNDMAQAYEKLGKHEYAIEVYSKILTNKMFSKQEYYVKTIEKRFKCCNRELEIKLICDIQDFINKYSSDKLIKMLKCYYDEIEAEFEYTKNKDIELDKDMALEEWDKKKKKLTEKVNNIYEQYKENDNDEECNFFKEVINRILKISENEIGINEIDEVKLKGNAIPINTFIGKLNHMRQYCDKSADKYVMYKTYCNDIEKRVNYMKESFEGNFLKVNKVLSKDFNGLKKQCLKNKVLYELMNKFVRNDEAKFLQVLRRWNSYTPIFGSGRGGGYYLKVNDVGIVIDPGFNFIKNFKEQNNSFSDINAILISHAHDDHTADLESILNLQHRYNDKIEKELKREVAIKKGILTDEVTDKNDYIDKFYKYKKKFFLCTENGVLRKYKGLLQGKYSEGEYSFINDEREFDDVIVSILRGGDIIDIKGEEKKNKKDDNNKVEVNEDNIIKIKAIKAKHKDLINLDSVTCLGFLIELKDMIIVYTGDTGWEKDNKAFQEQYERIRLENKGDEEKKIILIAHLGGFNDNERKFWWEDDCTDKGKMFYENHLGRLGLVKLVETLRPKVCIISEFGQEFTGVRIEIAKVFQDGFDKNNIQTKVLPGDVGLTFDLENVGEDKLPKVKVISNIDFKNKLLKYEYVDLDQVAVGEFRYENSLFYYKKDSHISESDCIQAFIEHFSDYDKEWEFNL